MLIESLCLGVPRNCCGWIAMKYASMSNHICRPRLLIVRYRSGIDFPAWSKDWKKSERNNKTIALYILYIPPKTKTINLAYKSKYNRQGENQVILLMITNSEQSDEADKWHYIALEIMRTDDGFNCLVRSLSRLFRGIIANNNGDFYCLGCLHSFQTDNPFKRHEKLCGNNDYCHVEIPTKDNKTLRYNHGEKSLKAPFTIYADLECLLIKEQSCQNSPKESYTERTTKHEPSGYTLSLICSFDKIKNKRCL